MLYVLLSQQSTILIGGHKLSVIYGGIAIGGGYRGYPS
jgi:hypothetical protein